MHYYSNKVTMSLQKSENDLNNNSLFMEKWHHENESDEDNDSTSISESEDKEKNDYSIESDDDLSFNGYESEDEFDSTIDDGSIGRKFIIT